MTLLGQGLRFLFWSATTAVVLLLGLLTLAGFAGSRHWAYDALSNFRLYYLLPLAAITLFTLWRQKYWLFWPTLLFALLNFIFIAPYYLPIPTASAAATTYNSSDQPPLRLLMSNVYYYNQEVDELMAYITAQDPDIVVLVEMTSELKRAMRPLYEQYPYQLDAPYQENIILSRLPFQASWYDHQSNRRRPDAIGQFVWQGQPFTLIGTHPSTPLSHTQMARRNAHLAHLAEQSRAFSPYGPVIVTGDFNTTPFSVHFQTILREGGLRDGRYGFGLHNSWPRQIPFLRIPIDHFLHTPNIQVNHFDSGPFGGSDHRPIVVEFSVLSDEG